MSDGRKCSVYLPNERKLELNLQAKLLGKDLLDIVTSHFKLKEKEYFGIAYKHEGGYYAWLQDEKKVLEHDIARKSGKVIDLLFAVKFYAESIAHLKQSRTIELFFLYVKSLVYKGQLEIEDSGVAFKLASYILQAICGDYSDDETARSHMAKLPLLPNRVLREHAKQHCETSVLELYKGLGGYSKGKAIISYMTLVETLPTYGIHYYKVKDKTSVAWWLGLSYKGIQQFNINDRVQPTKTFHWRQLENLYFREKKFSIEVNDQPPRINSTSSRDHLSTENTRKASSEVKVHAWYGSPALIKTIWIMSISQHHYYLDRKQSKIKLNAGNNLTNLSNDLTSNSQSLITPIKETPVMTRKQIKDVDITVKKGSKDETPECRAAKQQMSEALKSRRTKLEDQLYDKVQELKKLCLHEAEIIGKLPPEYIRYMDPNEQRPKIKKRIGAEFKVKLRNKTNSRNNFEKEYPTTVTAASSSSSGFSSEATDAPDELSQLETEFEILTQITSAAKKLVNDPSTRGKMRKQRLNSYKKSCDKLKAVEDKINVLRKKCGQKPSDRASMLIDDPADMQWDVANSNRDGTESERSSMSDGLLLDDDMSLSSGGDALSTHSTPAILNQSLVPSHPASAMVSRRNHSPADVDINEVLAMKRSATPPPSFERPSVNKNYHLRPNHADVPLSPVKIVPEEVKVVQKPPPRNWMRWDYPTKSRSKQGWHESSLDSIETTSTASRLSEDARSPEQRDVSPSQSLTGSKIKLSYPLDASAPQKVEMDSAFVDGRLSANSNQNNHNARVSASTENLTDSFNVTKLRREVSESALSELSTKSTPIVLSPGEQDASKDPRLPKIDETSHPNSQADRFRKRSSSFTESTNKPASTPHRNAIRKKPSHDKHTKTQAAEARQHDAYSVPQAARLSPEQTRSVRPTQEPQTPQFDTNVNIRMQYSARSSGHLSVTAPANPAWTQAPGTHTIRPALNRQLSGPSAVHHQVSKPPGGPTYGGKRGDQAVYRQAEQYQKQGYGAYGAYQTEPHPHGYEPYTEQGQFNEPVMSNSHRDYFNNAVYQDIGMGWVPSLYEYSSRASVCESASAQSKKEDIRRVLECHIAAKKRPSTSTSFHGDLTADKTSDRPKLPHSNSEQTWADYQRHLLSVGKPPSIQGSIASQAESVHSRANIFQHKPPPPPASGKPPKQETPLLLYQTQRQPKIQHQKSVHVTAPEVHHHHHRYNQPPTTHARPNQPHDVKQRQLLRHYLHHDVTGDPLDHVRNHVTGGAGEVPPQRRGQVTMYGVSAVPADTSSRPVTHRWHSDDARMLPGNAQQAVQHDHEQQYREAQRAQFGQFKGTETREKSPAPDQDTVVIQQLTMSPEGHAVSAFTVAKSAPNTPLAKLQGGPAFFGDSDDDSTKDDDSLTDAGDTGTLKSTHHHKSADDLLSASRDVSDDVKVKKAPAIIVHTPSFKSRIKPTLVPHGPIEIEGTDNRPITEERRSRGRQKSRPTHDGDAPLPPPRVKRAQSRSRKAEGAKEQAPNVPKKVASKSPKRATHAELPNRGKDVNSNEIQSFKKPPAARPNYSTVHTPPNRVESPRWGTPSPPGAVFSSGTLPRASKSRRKPERAPPPPSGSPGRAHLTLDVAAGATPSREKKSRRSKSEAWKIGPNGIPQPITNQAMYAAETLPHPHHAHVPDYYSQYAPVQPQYRTLDGGNPDRGWRQRAEAELFDRSRQRQRHQLSASAEDLLWTDNHDNQAGTLV